MNDQEKDRLIVEALGECWHEWIPDGTRYSFYGWKCRNCKNCKGYSVEDNPPMINLATWEGFGWTWEQAQKMEWWNDFLHSSSKTGLHKIDILGYYVHPIRFRDALAEFLERRKG